MRTLPFLVALSVGLAAAPALAQSLGIGGPLETSGHHVAPRSSTDVNNGRFLAFGGEFGHLRVRCSSCHGLDGTGDQAGAFPRLAGQSAWYLYSNLRAFADGQRPNPVMTPVAQELSDRQMQDVAAYYATRAGGRHEPEANQDAQLVKEGMSIAQSGAPSQGVPACSSCHGKNGAGQPPLYPFIGGQHEAYLRDQLHRFKSGARHDDPEAVMRQIASKLTDDQIKAVAAYYASLTPNVATGATIAQLMSARKANPGMGAASKPYVGATPNPQPGHGDVVVPGASNGGAGSGQ